MSEPHRLTVQLSYLPKTMRLVWAASPGLTLTWGLMLVGQGVLPAVAVYLTKLLVDSLVAMIKANGSWESARLTLILATLMAGAMVLTEILGSLSEWIRTAQAEFIQDHLRAMIQARSAAVDLAFYESPDYYDRLHRAQNDASTRPLSLLENGGSLLQNGITLVAMLTLMLPYGSWLPLVLLLSILPAFYIVFQFNRRYHRWWEQTTAARRWTHYYDAMLTHNAVAAELRLFNLGPHFQSAYQKLRRQLRSERLQLTKEQGLARLGAGLMAVLITGVVMIWQLWQMGQGRGTLGDLALFYQAFHGGQNLLRSLLGNVGQIYSNSLFLGNLFEFLELEPQITAPPQPLPAPSALQEGIRFRQISFRYPGSQRVILQNFDLAIPAGRIVAIVGANGAGKSTLLKLLCRFYDPTAGSIELDGLDIRRLAPADLRRRITVLFQFPVFYHATAGQNIALGDLAVAPGTVEIEAAARGAGAHEFITRLPQAYETLLGKWFADGVELSGGEWQRLALARAFLRQAPLVILDEPTSFMDSWAEAEWLARFRTLVEGRTALVVTHRFTTAMRADVIHVMDNGQIVESGSHADLLRQGGLYAQSWRAQTQGEAQARNELEPSQIEHNGRKQTLAAQEYG
ncbi:MAG: ABC transporter ATP-binding protein/permease [Anaerolineae bacterium]|nr:ABC transporter ATP-binding protein/permease [Anaerolineae bacterium]